MTGIDNAEEEEGGLWERDKTEETQAPCCAKQTSETPDTEKPLQFFLHSGRLATKKSMTVPELTTTASKPTIMM